MAKDHAKYVLTSYFANQHRHFQPWINSRAKKRKKKKEEIFIFEIAPPVHTNFLLSKNTVN